VQIPQICWTLSLLVGLTAISWGKPILAPNGTDRLVVCESRNSRGADPASHYLLSTVPAGINERVELRLLRHVDFPKLFSSKSVVVFVHGFNNDIEDSIQAARALRSRLDQNCDFILFRWPSSRVVQFDWHRQPLLDPTSYNSQRRSAQIAASSLSNLLTVLGRNRQVVVICHSMGGHVIESCAHVLNKDKKINVLALVAADIDGAMPEVDVLAKKAESLLHFYCRDDLVLRELAPRVANSDRIGLRAVEVGDSIEVAKEIATAADGSLRHSYCVCDFVCTHIRNKLTRPVAYRFSEYLLREFKRNAASEKVIFTKSGQIDGEPVRYFVEVFESNSTDPRHVTLQSTRTWSQVSKSIPWKDLGTSMPVGETTPSSAGWQVFGGEGFAVVRVFRLASGNTAVVVIKSLSPAAALQAIGELRRLEIES